jgi:hypothetical protein
MDEPPSDIPKGIDLEVTRDPNQLGANEKTDLSTKADNYVPPRSSALRISPELPVTHSDDGRSHTRKSMASSFSRLSRLLSNMVNLKKVMRDEVSCMYDITLRNGLNM